jgi:hypothetical protein
MSPYDVCVRYLALKKYFSDWKYDYVKYHGKTPLKYETYERRRDRYFFEKLERHRDPIGVLVFNLAENPGAWIRDIATGPGDEIYCKHQGVVEAMTHVLKRDLKELDPVFDKNFKCDEGMPIILKKVIGDKISMETAALLIEMSGARNYLRENYQDHLFEDLVIRVSRLSTFLTYDRAKARGIVLEHFQKKIGEIA